MNKRQVITILKSTGERVRPMPNPPGDYKPAMPYTDKNGVKRFKSLGSSHRYYMMQDTVSIQVIRGCKVKEVVL